MRSQVNKQRIKLRGFKPKSQIKYERRRRYKYKASYLKVQETLNYIELSRTMMAHRRRQDKLFPPEEYVDRLGIMEAPDDATFPGEIVINRELAPLVKPVPPPGGAVPPFPPQKN